MPDRITIACEHCGAKLTLADDSKLGKKIKCPKCSEVFVAATGDDDEIEELDDAAEEEDKEEVEDRPRRKAGAAAATAGKGKKGKGGKGKGKPAGSNLGLIIGGAVGVGVLLIGGLIGVLFATGVFGGGAKSDPNQIAVSSAPGNGVVGKLLQEQKTPDAAPPETPVAAVPAPVPPEETPGPKPVINPAADPAVDSSPPVGTFDQKWLPAKPEGLIRIRVADLWASPLVQPFAVGPQVDEFLAEMKKYGGLEPSMINSVTIVVHGAQDWLTATKIANDADSPNKPKASPPVLAIVTLNRPFDLSMLAQKPPFAKYIHNGGLYVQIEGLPNLPETPALYAPDAQTILVSDADGIKRAMDAGPNSSVRPELAFLDGDQHILIAGLTAPLDPKLQSQAEQMTLDLPAYAAEQRAYAEKVHGGSFGLKLTRGIEATTVIACKTPEAVQEMRSMIEQEMGSAIEEYQSAKTAMPPFATELLDFLVDNLNTSERNDSIQITTNIPASANDKLAQLPANLILWAATSGAMSQNSGGNPLSSLLGGLPGGEMFGGGPGGDDLSAAAANATTAEVTPENAPENVKLEAMLVDVPEPPPKPGARFATKPKKKDRILDVSISAKWTGEKEECLLAAAGKLKAKGGESAAGKKIKVALSTTMPGSDAKPPEMQPVALPQSSDPNVPLGRFEVIIPADETDPLKSLSGVCTLVTGTLVKEVTVENLHQQAGKSSDDEDLKAAGFTVKLAKSTGAEGSDLIIFSVKEGYLLSRPVVIDGRGKPVGLTAENGKSDRSQQLVLPDDEPRDKQDLGIKVNLYRELKEVSVPFTFENVELPEKRETESDEN